MSLRAQQTEKLFEALQAIKRKLRAKNEVVSDRALRSVTPSQWGVLRIVAHAEKMSIKEIARQLDVSSSATTQLVDGLVENGHLLRKDNPADRRSQHLEVAPTTRKQMRFLRKKQLQSLSDLFSVLTDAEFEKYLDLSTKVVRTLSHP